MLHRSYMATPTVEVSLSQVRRSQKERYGHGPASVPNQVIALTSSEVASERDLTSLSPIEDRAAFVFALEERVMTEGIDEAELWEWRRYMHCVCCDFIIVDKDRRRFFLAIQTRRELLKQGRAAQRSAVQLVQEVLQAWEDHLKDDAKLTTEKMFQMFNQQLGDVDVRGADLDDTASDPSLNVSKHFIESALNVKRNALDLPEVSAKISTAAELLQENSPWYNMHALRLLTAKLKQHSKEDVLWTMALQLDVALHDPGIVATWSNRLLAPKNGRGLWDKWLCKKRLTQELLGAELDSTGLPADEKMKLRKMLATVDEFRAHSGYKTGPCSEEKPASRIHLSGTSSAFELFYDLVEELIYKDSFDILLDGHNRNRGSVKDFLKKDEIQDLLTEIKSKTASVEAEEPVQSQRSEYEQEDGDATETPAKLAIKEMESGSASTAPAQASENGVYLGNTPQGRELWSRKMSASNAKVIKKAWQEAEHM